jgi:hypothetical protein
MRVAYIKVEEALIIIPEGHFASVKQRTLGRTKRETE